jgi:hypothetical protein
MSVNVVEGLDPLAVCEFTYVPAPFPVSVSVEVLAPNVPPWYAASKVSAFEPVDEPLKVNGTAFELSVSKLNVPVPLAVNVVRPTMVWVTD